MTKKLLGGKKNPAIKPRTTESATVAPDELATGSNAPLEIEKNLEKALGAHVKRLRRQKDLSVAGLAEAAGISAGMMSKFENGQISSSLNTLQAIAQALGISVSSLFSEFENQCDCSHVASGQGVAIKRRGTKAGHVYHLLGHSLKGPIAVEPHLIELKKRSVPYTEFRHAGIEFIYMISGRVSYRHDDQLYHLQAGDSLMFDSGAAHGPQNLKELPATYLSIIIYEQSNT